MGRPIKYRIKIPKIKIINRCIYCGKEVSSGVIVCSNCRKKQSRIFG